MEGDQGNIEEQQRLNNEEQKQKRFIPELGKLPWYFKIALFFVAIFLISLPYILMEQPNPFNQAVAAYDSLCKMKENNDINGISHMIDPSWNGKDVKKTVAALECVPRSKGYKLFIKVDPEKHYILLVKGHDKAIRVRFSMDDKQMRWLPVIRKP